MKLILKTELEEELNLRANETNIVEGSGQFLMEGGVQKEKSFLVRYYLPKNIEKETKPIFILPGAGRNARDYRDAWIAAAEEYGLLVLVPEYSEIHYPGFWSYNLAGMIHDVDIQNEAFSINQNPDEWLFEDFDRIFNVVKEQLDLSLDRYDMFGHSAGGQVLHRFAIFKPDNKADRILASNSGWYTVPTVSEPFPYGIKNIRDSLTLDFTQNLVLFLGEKDNASERRGHLRRSPEVDKQGLHRLARGLHFFDESRRRAESKNLVFNWKLEIVPDVGHDYKEMSRRAAIYLYERSE